MISSCELRWSSCFANLWCVFATSGWKSLIVTFENVPTCLCTLATSATSNWITSLFQPRAKEEDARLLKCEYITFKSQVDVWLVQVFRIEFFGPQHFSRYLTKVWFISKRFTITVTSYRYHCGIYWYRCDFAINTISRSSTKRWSYILPLQLSRLYS